VRGAGCVGCQWGNGGRSGLGFRRRVVFKRNALARVLIW
jgi:hypothetical protein